MADQFFQKRSRVISVRITPDSHEALADASTKEGKSMSALVAEMIDEGLDRRDSGLSSSIFAKAASLRRHIARKEALISSLQEGLRDWEAAKDPETEAKILDLLELVDFPLPFEVPDALLERFGKRSSEQKKVTT